MEAVQDVEEFSGPNSNEICQHDVQVQIHTLLNTFLSLEKSKSSYETGLRSFNSFRQTFRYQRLWPPPLNHFVVLIAYLSCNW